MLQNTENIFNNHIFQCLIFVTLLSFYKSFNFCILSFIFIYFINHTAYTYANKLYNRRHTITKLCNLFFILFVYHCFILFNIILMFNHISSSLINNNNNNNSSSSSRYVCNNKKRKKNVFISSNLPYVHHIFYLTWCFIL